MTASTERGRFIVLDGIDGCGKSTQAERLTLRLARDGRRVLHVRDPGTTPLGERLRAVLLARDLEISPRVEALIFCAARAQMLESSIEPALARGEHVVCERFHPSTFAYQAIAGDVDPDALLALLETWAGTPRPDLVIVLDIDPARAAARRAGALDRIEDKGLEFQRRVAAGMRRYAEVRPRGLIVVDADAPLEVVERTILDQVLRVL